MTKKILISLILFQTAFLFAQDDLLNDIETNNANEPVTSAFKALQIVTSQSTKLAAKGDLYFVVSHRFGTVKTGFKDFLGLDNATTKIGFIYGFTNKVSVSIARHTLFKTFEGGIKYQIISQKDQGNPFTIVGYNCMTINTLINEDDYNGLGFAERLSFVNQLLISRKFNDKLSLQLMPTYIHKNLIQKNLENTNQYALGLGGRQKISNRVSLNAEYFYNFDTPEATPFTNPLSLGIDIDTGGHIFQLLFSNAQPMTEATYITNGVGDWGKGDFYFGFNLYRVF